MQQPTQFGHTQPDASLLAATFFSCACARSTTSMACAKSCTGYIDYPFENKQGKSCLENIASDMEKEEKIV
jgi:hypothetical protein